MTTNPHIAHVDAAIEAEAPVVFTAMELVCMRVRLRAQRRSLWLRSLMEGDGTNVTANYHRLIDGILARRDHVEAEKAWYADHEESQAISEELAAVERALEADYASRLAVVRLNFGLSTEEICLLHACIALASDPSLERVFSYLQDHNLRGYVTLPLVARLFGMVEPLNPALLGPLRTWRFVQESSASRGEPAQWEIDPWFFNWLLGHNRLDPVLVGHAQVATPLRPLPEWPLDGAVLSLQQVLAKTPHQKARFIVRGVDGSGRQTFAACIAEAFGLPLLVMRIDEVSADEWPKYCLHAQRQAFLSGFALGWRGDGLADRIWPQDILPVQLQFLFLPPEGQAHAQQQVIDLQAELGPLSIPTRRQLWQSLVPATADWDPASVEHLVQHYPTTIGQIALAGTRSVQSASDAAELLRDGSRHKLGKLAQLLHSDYQWEDLMLHPHLLESLQDFVYEAHVREAWWESSSAKRLFPQGKGLMALFAGPSGTGKTMAAQVIARALQQDLFRVDLSSVISKYVGETSKHLERILSQARSMHAVLLFDEADSLFGKRTDIKDAHDRFANADTNYLLQAIESYPGVAILATNRKANIDVAFLRRLRFVFEFVKPEAAQRLQMWINLLREIAGADTVQRLSEPLRQLSVMLDLTGAQIKYAILASVFIAHKEDTPLNLKHLLKGVERELAKEGKGLSPETGKRLDIYHR